MKRIFAFAVLGLLSACSDREPPAEEGAFDELTDTIDRAEAVQQQLDEQKERLDRAVDEAERKPEPERG